uniref:SH3 and cysteine rich domain n=1 Tax=Amphilophus citrinellus TaxID=61819 RepID=A0A3Q0R1P5_AMPCI
MIPPASTVQDESGGNEDERDQNETPKSPTANASQQESKFQLQRLKRSLSFKTKSIRSKSADNFFRTSSENKTELLSDVSSSTGHLCNIGMAPPHSTNLPIPPVPPAIPCAPPPTSRSQPRNPMQVDSAGHCFMEHIFKKPTFCDVCNHMIVNTAKHGLRCKACKMSLHHKCENGVGQQRCMGKLTSDLDKVPEEVVAHSSRQELSRKHSDDIENGTEQYHQPERKPDSFPSQLQKDVLKLNTYVALYNFTAQEGHDLEMAGDRILVADDSNDDWWKQGVIEDRIGFFPAAFAHQLRAGDQVFRCNRTFIGCKEQGQITLKEGQFQICVSTEGERSGFIRVASGKKRGFVPCDVLEII